MKSIYIAAPYEDKEQCKEWSQGLDKDKYVVCSSWLYINDLIDDIPSGDAGDPKDAPKRQEISVRDQNEILLCDIFIHFAPARLTRGGANVEFGFALALQHFRPDLCILIAGSRPTTFHWGHPFYSPSRLIQVLNEI